MVLSIQAPAKLNRFLAVLGRRADGFHELELVTTVLEGVAELTDTLSGEPGPRLSLSISGPAGEGLETDESNLVIRAWRLLEAAAERALPTTLHLEKRIPHGAGLGGGSSDAAAALRLGNSLFNLELAERTLLDLAAALGSDVPLFLLGGTTLGLGRGERVFPLRPLPFEPLLLVHPGLHVSTPNVYRVLAELGYADPRPLLSLPEGIAPPWRNDLTAAALKVCPALVEVREALAAAGGEPLLCGSGSCWAARFDSTAHRDRAVAMLRRLHESWCVWPI
ncbi:4-(cytidine 5'-diphospho)-2-C-methyl-D-erythritol kinase [Geothrix sp. PMB-07]|uniref:4-(cytidine 5'-diphospho)-2-C-methyl-D-erythritol kinase n=1 Tax=Geothrix sp. PMB-07 TaxID=3068640 RepID=UPI0027413A87|nr:4-(cytidine 5'-diphospho)-2-C-methyl-D-erythritol kinase [Geothrix sp. PMB-07]WLT33043.1 4-(cytidine 5'-diphospho)-2-C-methyl-D-erythritol kinase [Geothrix sp. PMB-07]